MILIIISEIYPVAKPDALIDIVYVNVVVSLDVVQKGSNADHHTTRKKEDEVSSRTTCGHSQKMWLPASTRAGELTDNNVSEAYSSGACVCKN